jgi:hypothetical protein
VEWSEFLHTLQSVPMLLDRPAETLGGQLHQEAVQQLAMTVAQGYGVLFSQDARYPQLISFTNPIVTSGTNPDFMYFYSALDGRGRYRLSGTRGTSLFIHVVQNSGMIGLHDMPGPPLSMLDVDSLTIAADGSFSVLISGQPPTGDQQNWWRLDPMTTSLSIRQASYDWSGEIDGRFAVECLDKWPPARRPAMTEIAARLSGVGRFADRYINYLRTLAGAVGSKPVNTLHINNWSQFGGLSTQYYYQGHYQLESDEALIIETEVPERVRYWGIVTLDELFNALDWVNNQSSINGFQATLDSDGRFRAVLAIADPGVPNWLDPIGRQRGFLQGRWFEASCGPVPRIERVKLADLRNHLPADTPRVSADQRDERLRDRRRGAQLRRKW